MKNLPFFVRFVALLLLGGMLSSCDKKDFSPSFMPFSEAPLGGNLFVDVINAQSDSICRKVSSISFEDDDYSLAIDSTTILFSEEAYQLGGFKPDIRNLVVLGMKHIAVTDTFFRRAESGCNTIIACEFDKLGTPVNASFVKGDRFNVKDFVYQLNSDKIPLTDVKLATTGETFKLPSILCSRYFEEESVEYLFRMFQSAKYECKVLAYANNKPIAISFKDEAGGVVTLVSTPLLFSNFGISYNHWKAVPFVNGILRQSGFYSKQKDKADRLERVYFCNVSYSTGALYEGEFRQLPKHKSSGSNSGSISGSDFLGELAKHILLIIAAVFSVFLIRRRQQAIPLFEGYRNRTADYVRQVGVLYLDDGDLNLVLKNKVVYFFSEVAERLHFQLSDKEKLDEHAAFLAASLGCPDLDLVPFLKITNKALDNKLDVDAESLAELSDKMNVIVKVLRGEVSRDHLFILFKVKNIKD